MCSQSSTTMLCSQTAAETIDLSSTYEHPNTEDTARSHGSLSVGGEATNCADVQRVGFPLPDIAGLSNTPEQSTECPHLTAASIDNGIRGTVGSGSDTASPNRSLPNSPWFAMERTWGRTTSHCQLMMQSHQVPGAIRGATLGTASPMLLRMLSQTPGMEPFHNIEWARQIGSTNIEQQHGQMIEAVSAGEAVDASAGKYAIDEYDEIDSNRV